MNSLRAAFARGRQNALDRKIAFARRAGPDQVRLVRQRDVQRLRIRRGIDRDGADAEIARRADDPAGDLAAICNQDLGEHLSHGVMAGLVPASRYVGTTLLP